MIRLLPPFNLRCQAYVHGSKKNSLAYNFRELVGVAWLMFRMSFPGFGCGSYLSVLRLGLEELRINKH